jgi:hypothetical protein
MGIYGDRHSLESLEDHADVHSEQHYTGKPE